MQGHKDTTHNPILPNEKGQMSIFLAVVVVVITGLLAFIVNIGMFVKAKINLQNAVDSAAYSGASVQARYLTNVAYMNWHMRNVYKEWMFKYYVLGQLGLKDLKDGTSPNVDFRLPPLVEGLVADPSNTSLGDRPEYNIRDPFNVPSVCINFSESFNICSTYSLPGLPRYESLGLPGIDETHNTFIRNLVEQKAKDCSARSSINFTVARQWTYGLSRNDVPIAPGTPQIALDRDGAFPRALEAAIRIRNLERIINEPPKNNVSSNANSALCNTIGCTDLASLEAQSSNGQAPIHERTSKAFWAGFRTLSKSPDNINNSLKNTFVLTELAPQPKPASSSLERSLSYYLIPDGGGYEGYSSDVKHYLDLQLNLVNYAIFYTLFTTVEANSNAGSAPIDQASCSSTKVAIPVPGYPLGYTKNPNLITYYAVKGEAYFTGLFNPFQDPVRMVAYSAAKPFGGRIGPKLFNISADEQTLEPRERYSFAYLSGLNLTNSSFEPGKPIPYNSDFWVGSSASNIIGGTPSGGSEVKYSIPNLVFDFVDGGFATTAANLEIINQYDGDPTGSASQSAGLHNRNQYFRFKGPDLLGAAGLIGATEIRRGIRRALQPTGYEAANYLIPTMQRHHEAQQPPLETIGMIPNGATEGTTGTVDNPKQYFFYAPLFGSGLLYKDPNDVRDVLVDYVSQNQNAIASYLDTLQEVANDIRALGVAGGEDQYAQAAGSIYGPAGETVYDTNSSGGGRDDLYCTSIAGNFNLFFFGHTNPGTPIDGGNPANCPTPMVDSIINVWNSRVGNNAYGDWRNVQTGDYIVPDDVDVASGNAGSTNDLGIQKYMTAYMPGPNHGATNDGIEDYPIETQELPKYRRSTYAVKYVPLRSLISDNSEPQSYEQGNFGLFVETMEGFTDDQFGFITSFQNGLAPLEEVRPVKH